MASPVRIASVAREPGDIAAYVELHVEQGAILDRAGIPIGVVEGIVGIRRWNVTVEGFANHAGTTPMDQRQDALYAAARFVTLVRRLVTDMSGTPVQCQENGSTRARIRWIELVANQVRLVIKIEVQRMLNMWFR